MVLDVLALTQRCVTQRSALSAAPAVKGFVGRMAYQYERQEWLWRALRPCLK